MMPMQERRLDLRDFQDIVDEARKLIPRYCPEWTDHNVSDPGITLIELFAWMTEMILYQLNRVPDEMYERFLDLIGVQRLPAEAAVADVSFYLSAPPQRPITIPPDTEVATDRSEVEEAIIFSTARQLTIAPPIQRSVKAWREGRGFEDYLPYITSGLVQAAIFNEQPLSGDSLYIGYEADLAGQSLLLRVECLELEGAHIDPRDPPLAWEYWSAIRQSWQPLRLLDQSGTGRLRQLDVIDPTHGLNRSGEVYFSLPMDSAPRDVDGVEATWLRIRYFEKAGQGFTSSPRIVGLRTDCIGATVPARQVQLIRDEFLGRSDGEAGQSFTLGQMPVVREPEPHVIDAYLEDEVTEWQEVEDFSETGEGDRHFIIHYPSGQVRFGPSVRGRDGTQRQYGAVPRRDASLRIRSYRSGGGTTGNVGQGTISQLKTSVPYVAAVVNYEPARGGLNEETIDEVKLRALSVLKRPTAAVTREDYERLVVEVPGVGRARCVATGQNGIQAPGTIRLLLVPELADPAVELTTDLLTPTPALITAVAGRLEERKTVGTVVELGVPPLVWAEVDALFFVRRGTDPAAAQTAAVTRLRTLFNPGRQNRENAGFGAAITHSQIAGVLQGVPGVLYIERVRLRRQGEPDDLTRLQAPPDSLLVLGNCGIFAEVVED